MRNTKYKLYPDTFPQLLVVIKSYFTFAIRGTLTFFHVILITWPYNVTVGNIFLLYHTFHISIATF